MKPKFSKISIFLSLLLALPAIAPARAAAVPAVAISAGAPAAAIVVVSGRPAEVGVVLAVPTAVVLPPRAAQSCQYGLPAAGGLLQDNEIINLNQPASCFNLAVTAPAASQVVVVVRQPAAAPVKVVPNGARLSPFALQNSPIAAKSWPAVPAAAAGELFLLVLIKKIRESGLNYWQALSRGPGFVQPLGVLRC
ncbi:MAG TPA: hypothetical protein VHA30_03155 [Patescibacteria group bacterium]|nr:hypothetical protein [Patescibacteria group bacterium]